MIYHILLLKNSFISKKTPKKIFHLRRYVGLSPTPRPRPSVFGKNSLPLKIPVSAPDIQNTWVGETIWKFLSGYLYICKRMFQMKAVILYM